MPFTTLNAYLSRLPQGQREIDKLWMDDEGRVQGQFFNCSLTSQFQPVCSLEGRLCAFDARSHSYSKENSGLSVWRILNNAASDDESIELDRLCRILHVLNFFRQAEHFDGALLIGVHERLLAAVSSNHGAVFRRILDGLELPIDRILLQLPHANPNHHWLTGFVIENYRRNGFKVATRAASAIEAAQQLMQFQPDLIRVDSRASGDVQALSEVIEHADALGTTLLFASVDREHELRGVASALDVSGTILTDRLWFTGNLAGHPRAWLGGDSEPETLTSDRKAMEAPTAAPQI